MDRRDFIKAGVLAAAGSGITSPAIPAAGAAQGGQAAAGAAAENGGKQSLIRVTAIDSNFEREPLIRPLGFKGGFLTELWQTASRLHSEKGGWWTGLATQSVLYGDAGLFESHSEAAGNALMYLLAERALEQVAATPFRDPVELLGKIFPALMESGRELTRKPDLNPNFVYNALISVDNAAWLLYAAERGFRSFDEMIPEEYRQGVRHRTDKVAFLYQVAYNMPTEELVRAVKEDGYFAIKIKTGHPGTEAEMLQADMDHLTAVHRALKDMRTPQTADGKLIYTMDANGRYQKKESLQRYLDHARRIGAFDQILFYEEPFDVTNEAEVGDLGIPVGADESIYDEESTLRRLSQGYQVIVLKGIAKTLSLSLRIASLAASRGIPCVCSDLTVNPILVDWHKNLACRVAPFPGLNMGLMETNGSMNYRNWETMESYHPFAGKPWTRVRNGAFELDKEFYELSGGIFAKSPHYEALFKRE